jgi:phospholipase/carboxylesterase
MTPKLDKYNKTLIWLHGLGDEGQSFISLFDEDISPFPSNVKIVLPTAKSRPVTINNGMYCNSWYDITALGNVNGVR